MELECAVQKYAWGVHGLKSSVAQLAKAASPDLEVPEDEPFAELWMGTHPSGPSVIKGNGMSWLILDFAQEVLLVGMHC